MSVLIKGMEMPTSCDDCEFCQRDISSYDWCCVPMTNGRSKPLDEPVLKPDWCPLIPVPNHGRLIDADAFFDDLLFPSKQFEQGMRELIGDAPTVIPAEETIQEATND